MLMSVSKLGTSTHTPVKKMIKKKKASERGRGWGVGGKLGRHYSVDWTTGLDYWTHGNCLWRRKEQEYTEIHTAIQESRVIFHRSQHVVLNSVRSWRKCAIKNWSRNPGNEAK